MNQPPIRSLMLKDDSSYAQLSDEELVQHYKNTFDGFYVGLLFERYVDVIFGISLKYLKNRQDAEDMLSSVFEKLTDVLKNKEVQTFRNWLFVLVKNQCVSQLRSVQSQQQRQKRYIDYISQLTAPEELMQVWKEEKKNDEEVRLKQVLAQIPRKQRRCIEYFYFEQKSYKEIAELMNETVGKIRSYIQNGRRNLKIMLTDKQ